ncbi:hypothetical protein ACFC08_28635 [Streptomyces sp. NPDC056112]|uniref:hypothetical protein n=1 Tax=Streptomyces sp. NPDC056112 TaxID=3345715 RepID=UPI0035DCBD9F
MTTPAEELRTAAQKLRSLTMPVAEQHPGPWDVHNPNGYPQAVFSPAADVILCETLDEIDAPKPTAPYIAVMHPGVGAALVDLLEARAWIAENDPGAFGTVTDTAALAVARAINGGTV